jgi:hypothetical protein
VVEDTPVSDTDTLVDTIAPSSARGAEANGANPSIG